MRKNYTAKYKAEAVLEVLREAESLNEIAGRLEVHPNMLGRWKNEAVKNLFTVFDNSKGDQLRKHETQVQELYAQIGELTTKLGWLKKKSGIDV
ncbi:MAG: transposase [Peptococcaceae bacterium]|jgi:transposase-like protein|nr:transposase [Peptococcaceae bacterium]